MFLRPTEGEGEGEGLMCLLMPVVVVPMCPHMPSGGQVEEEGEGEGHIYIPPSSRGGGGKGSKAPPDLKSAVAFPSLQDTAKKGEGR